jgi:hypothetical protein
MNQFDLKACRPRIGDEVWVKCHFVNDYLDTLIRIHVPISGHVTPNRVCTITDHGWLECLVARPNIVAHVRKWNFQVGDKIVVLGQCGVIIGRDEDWNWIKWDNGCREIMSDERMTNSLTKLNGETV